MVPIISVVIPVHNRPVLLSRALTSVSCQTIRPLEVVVVDDGSSQPIDDTLKELCPGVKIIKNDKNAGVAAARNRGIEHAQGEWIALLDSDDEWVSLKLEKQVQYLQEFPHLRAIHTDEKWVRNNNEVNPPVYLNKSNHLLWERSLRHCLICPSSVLLHKSILKQSDHSINHSLSVRTTISGCDYSCKMRSDWLMRNLPLSMVGMPINYPPLHGGWTGLG